jgi:hypothetical protein
LPVSRAGWFRETADRISPGNFGSVLVSGTHEDDFDQIAEASLNRKIQTRTW